MKLEQVEMDGWGDAAVGNQDSFGPLEIKPRHKGHGQRCQKPFPALIRLALACVLGLS